MDRAGATRNRWRGRVVVLVTVAAVLVMAGCEAQVTDAVNGARTTGGVAALPVTATLTTAARAHSQAMCAAGAVTPSTSPATSLPGGDLPDPRAGGSGPARPDPAQRAPARHRRHLRHLVAVAARSRVDRPALAGPGRRRRGVRGRVPLRDPGASTGAEPARVGALRDSRSTHSARASSPTASSTAARWTTRAPPSRCCWISTCHLRRLRCPIRPSC